MKILKTTTAVLACGFFLGAVSGAWSASSEPAPQNAQVAKVPRSDSGSLLGLINSLLIRSEIHQGQEGCKPGQLYGQHDVVGDPQSCFMNKLNLPSAVGP